MLYTVFSGRVLFFVYCSSIFESKKDLTFAVSELSYSQQKTPRTAVCAGSLFKTASHPTVIFGAHGNSGLGRFKEQEISRRERHKVPEMPQNII